MNDISSPLPYSISKKQVTGPARTQERWVHDEEVAICTGDSGANLESFQQTIETIKFQASYNEL